MAWGTQPTAMNPYTRIQMTAMMVKQEHTNAWIQLHGPAGDDGLLHCHEQHLTIPQAGFGKDKVMNALLRAV